MQSAYQYLTGFKEVFNFQRFKKALFLCRSTLISPPREQNGKYPECVETPLKVSMYLLVGKNQL
jgi:hypothetical protein